MKCKFLTSDCTSRLGFTPRITVIALHLGCKVAYDFYVSVYLHALFKLMFNFPNTTLKEKKKKNCDLLYAACCRNQLIKPFVYDGLCLVC
jgi:hypothetical protein